MGPLRPVLALATRVVLVYDFLMAPRTSKASSKGMRIQLQGLRSTKDLRAMLHEAIDNLEALGITHARGANLYLTPCNAEGQVLTPLGAGRTKIDQLTIEGPYPSVADEHGVK